MSALNENIKKFRELRRMNQKELSERLHKSRAVISNWERGENSPDPDTIEQICKVLEVTPNMIFGWEKCPDYERYLKRLEMYKGKIQQLQSERARIESEIKELQLLSAKEMMDEV